MNTDYGLERRSRTEFYDAKGYYETVIRGYKPILGAAIPKNSSEQPWYDSPFSGLRTYPNRQTYLAVTTSPG